MSRPAGQLSHGYKRRNLLHPDYTWPKIYCHFSRFSTWATFTVMQLLPDFCTQTDKLTNFVVHGYLYQHCTHTYCTHAYFPGTCIPLRARTKKRVKSRYRDIKKHTHLYSVCSWQLGGKVYKPSPYCTCGTAIVTELCSRFATTGSTISKTGLICAAVSFIQSLSSSLSLHLSLSLSLSL